MLPARFHRIAARALLAILALAAFTFAGFAGAGRAEAQQEAVTVFAAASLKTALDASAPAFTAQSGRKLVFSYAASSGLAKQLEQGAKADVFITADLDWMDYVQKAGSIDAASRFNLLGNSLVLIAPAGPQVSLALDAAGMRQGLGPDGRLAIGDPASVPAGKYAKAALESLGIWSAVSGRLAPAESVRVALAYVARGETPLGVVYRTDANAEPKVQVVAQFKEGSHPPIVYPVALTAAKSEGGRAYLAFLTSTAAKQEFYRQGFTVLAGK